MFYSDTTQAWNLHSRKRLLIDFGGIYFQTIILIPLSYYFNRTGSLLAGYLIFLNYIIILSNLNPLLKYDGYWIVTDMFNIPNVRQKTSLLLTNSLKAIFIPKRKHGANLLEGLNTRSRIFLISYTVLANIFFIYFFGFLLPKVMVAVSGQIIKDLRLISAMPVLTQWPGYRQFFSLLFTLLLKSLILLSLVRVVYTLFKKIISFVKSLIYDWNIE